MCDAPACVGDRLRWPGISSSIDVHKRYYAISSKLIAKRDRRGWFVIIYIIIHRINGGGGIYARITYARTHKRGPAVLTLSDRLQHIYYYQRYYYYYYYYILLSSSLVLNIIVIRTEHKTFSSPPPHFPIGLHRLSEWFDTAVKSPPNILRIVRTFYTARAAVRLPAVAFSHVPFGSNDAL